ncbi:DUF4192 family protein [Leucobacter weissii]|uniref:DUF4192 family protein n=1 Tax=Leucobacter weissii TaxID=1983706 RepID=A0A939MLR1_9MICO|nr:DUF4192 family protein [Leucobacter weissii]MBO1900771.1 DUF4192 family protein [Leucobacter weissii]
MPPPPPLTGSDQRSVLRCGTTADLLAALPFLTGFTAENSLFIVMFEGSRSGHVARMDLPRDQEDPGMGLLIDAVCELLRATGAGAEAPALVIVSDDAFASSGGAPWRGLARQLRGRFRREGWRLRDLAVMARDGWASLMGEARPRVGRPLDEIRASPIAAAAAAAIGPTDAPRPLSELGRIGPADASRAAAVVDRLAELDRRESPDREEAGGSGAEETARASRADASVWLHGTARVAEACFRSEDVPDSRLCARFVRAAEDPRRWLLLALTAVTRARFVMDAVQEAEDLVPGRFSEVPIDLDAGPTPGPARGWSIRRILCSLAAQRAGAEKIRRTIEVVGSIAAHTPEARRPGLLALLAWAWWLRGTQTVASGLLDDALRLTPGHELSLMMQRLIATPPAWTRRPVGDG